MFKTVTQEKDLNTAQVFFIIPDDQPTEAVSTNFVIWFRVQLGKFAQNNVIDTKLSKSGTSPKILVHL